MLSSAKQGQFSGRMNQSLKSHFLLDPDIVFLNHGSFGATPRPVFDAYQAWQRRLERQPVQFLVNELPAHLAHARQALGDYLHAPVDDLVFIPNATFGLNIVARSLQLGPGDEVLTTDHEYGACNNVWRFLSQKRGFTYRPVSLPQPITSNQAIVDQLWSHVTPRTKVIFLSHITSATALTLPIADICRRAQAEDILTIIDGAHVPGQLPLNLTQLGADFYFGNAHKWLMSPKGAAFLYARHDRQSLIEPLIVGWGWGEERTLSFGSDFLDYLQWLGTNDLSAYLAVPDAISFQAEHDWPTVRANCHTLLNDALCQIGALTGRSSFYPNDTFYHQMAVARLPHQPDLTTLKTRLYNEHRIEIPCINWQNQHFIRLSIQAYNTPADVDTLLIALTKCI